MLTVDKSYGLVGAIRGANTADATINISRKPEIRVVGFEISACMVLEIRSLPGLTADIAFKLLILPLPASARVDLAPHK